ncbi:MAG: M20/M25/M40 family metallo-hydrolase [Caldilineaceae bacterium]
MLVMIAGKLGQDLVEGATGGGSDGNITGALGIPTLDGLGVPGHGAHADHEHIETDKIAATGARWLVAFCWNCRDRHHDYP